MLERFEQYNEIEEQLNCCHQDIDYTLWCKQYGQFFIDLMRAIDGENLNNIKKISELESYLGEIKKINNILEKSLLTIMKEDIGITLSHEDKNYILFKEDEQLKLVENNEAPENQVIRIEL